jgi:hypothetical protein
MTSTDYEKLWQISKEKGALRKLLVSWQCLFQKFDLTPPLMDIGTTWQG